MAQELDWVMIQKGKNGYRVSGLVGRREVQKKDYKTLNGAYNAWLKAPRTAERVYFSGSKWTPEELKKLSKKGMLF